MTDSLSSAGTTEPINAARGWRLMTDAGMDSLRLTAPFAIAGVVVGVVASAIQVKPGINAEVLKPRFSVLNPISGAKRLLSSRSLVTLGKASGQAVGVTTVVLLLSSRQLRVVVMLPTMDRAEVIATLAKRAGAPCFDVGGPAGDRGARSSRSTFRARAPTRLKSIKMTRQRGDQGGGQAARPEGDVTSEAKSGCGSASARRAVRG